MVQSPLRLTDSYEHTDLHAVQGHVMSPKGRFLAHRRLPSWCVLLFPEDGAEML